MSEGGRHRFCHQATGDFSVKVECLLSLGAERIAWDRYPEDPDFVVRADPDGNRFCIVDLSHEDSLIPPTSLPTMCRRAMPEMNANEAVGLSPGPVSEVQRARSATNRWRLRGWSNPGLLSSSIAVSYTRLFGVTRIGVEMTWIVQLVAGRLEASVLSRLPSDPARSGEGSGRSPVRTRRALPRQGPARPAAASDGDDG